MYFDLFKAEYLSVAENCLKDQYDISNVITHRTPNFVFIF